MSDKKIAELLSKFVPVNALNPDNIVELAQKARVNEVPRGLNIFQAGDRDKKHIFLIKGDVELVSQQGVTKSVSGGTPEARHALAHAQPRAFTARAQSTAASPRTCRRRA